MFGRRKRAEKKKRGVFRRILRTIALAILFAFLFGFVVGTFLRRELDEPVRYMGARPTAESPSPLASVLRPADPGDVRHVLPRILVARDHEEQIG